MKTWILSALEEMVELLYEVFENSEIIIRTRYMKITIRFKN